MKALRYALYALVVVTVVLFGGTPPVAQAVLEVSAAILFLAWGALALRRGEAEVHVNWLYAPLLGFWLLGLCQNVFGLSAYAYLTKVELLRWSALLLLFFLVVQLVRTTQERIEVFSLVIILGFSVSLFGIVQHLSPNGALYWHFALQPGAHYFGPFVDSDHFAGFVELTASAGLSLLFFRSYQGHHLALLLFLTLIPIAALVLSASRGGIIAFLFEVALLTLLSGAYRMRRRQVAASVGVTCFATLFVLWLGIGPTIDRFRELNSGDISHDVRLSMYGDTWHVFTHHLWVGTGLGTLIVTYPQYASFYSGQVVDHAHNDYLELLADAGLIGGLAGLSFVALLFWRGAILFREAKDPLHRALIAGPLAACGGLLLHSLVDFNLHIPANALLFLLLASQTAFEGGHSVRHKKSNKREPCTTAPAFAYSGSWNTSPISTVVSPGLPSTRGRS